MHRRLRLSAVALGAGLLAGGTLLVAAPAARAGAAPSALGKVAVEGGDGQKPTVSFARPFAVTKSASTELVRGTGPRVEHAAKITFDFVVVDGRTGKELGTSYGASAQASATMDDSALTPAIVTGLVGTAVGSRVLIAVAPKDGLTAGLASSGVKKKDTILFLLDVRSIRSPLARATGDPVVRPAGLPTVAVDAANGKPTITVPPAGAAAPTDLVVQPLFEGAGPAVAAGQTVTVHYTGVLWGSGKQFDSSWTSGKPIDFVIGTGKVIKGWDQGLVGQTVGSQVLLVVPPALGYGAAGQSNAGISGTDTLVFVVDLLDAY